MSVYAACALCVITGSLIWFAFTLYSDSKLGKAEALKSFKTFALHTGEILSEANEEAEPSRLQTQLERLCYNYQPYVQAVLIRDADDTVFTWPKDTDVFFYNGKDSVGVKNLPFFFTATQMHIPVNNSGTTVTIHTALQTLPMQIIFNRGQVVFFLLLLIVLMTIAVLIFSYSTHSSARPQNPVLRSTANSSKYTGTTQKVHGSVGEAPLARSHDTTGTTDKAYQEPTAVHQEQQTVEPKSEGEARASVPFSDQLESLNRLHIYNDTPRTAHSSYMAESENCTQNETTEAIPAQIKNRADRERQELIHEVDTKSSTDPSRTSTIQHIKVANYGSFENHNQPFEPEPEDAEQEDSASNTPAKQGPHGDHEEYHSLEEATLIEELATAITETAAAEEDLTLLLIHASDVAHNQQVIHILRTTLDRIHKLVVFNKDILGLIIFYAPLDQAMQLASRVYDEIREVLHDSIKKTLRIGLTTRAGRLVPAPRMIEEATAAVSKAIEAESDPIVAFRVNPDKYRKYLTS